MYNILFFGTSHPHSTSFHRVGALQRMGHSVAVCDPWQASGLFSGNKWMSVFHYRTGYRYIQSKMSEWVSSMLAGQKPDLVWVDSGEFFGEKSLLRIKQFGYPILLYNNDNPISGRDGRRFESLLQALPYFDLCVIRGNNVIKGYFQHGARRLLRVFMSYDEVAHQPYAHACEIPPEFCSEVAFIGTWMRNEARDEFLCRLIDAGVPLSIWGGRWDRAKNYKYLKSKIRGPAIGGREYAAALQGAKICLGLLSKGNMDLHTRRSVEVPYAGSVFCGERTSEHLGMYRDGVEAVFWNDAAECAQLCNQLLSDTPRREQIRIAGMQRVRELGMGNQDILRFILDTLFDQTGPEFVAMPYPLYSSDHTGYNYQI